MKKYTLLFISLLMVAYTFASDTDAVFKKIKKEYILHTDGSIEYKYYKELKYLTPYSFNRMFGETFIVYNPDYQELIIHKSYTIMADGKKVETPENAFNKVLPRAAANYPAFNKMVEMVVTHTALEVGATIFLEYSIISKPNNIHELMGTAIITEDVPVEDYEVQIQVPARRAFEFTVMNFDGKPKMNTNNKYATYNWHFTNVSARAYETSAPSSYVTSPTIKFSTFPDAKTALEKWTSAEVFSARKRPQFMNLIHETTSETNNEWDAVRAMQAVVVDNITSKHNPLKWSNYKVQNPVLVWNNNVGNELEKTNLLYQICVLADLKAKIVGFMPDKLWDPQVVSFDDFIHFGVLVSTKDFKPVILSAIQKNKKSLEWEYANTRVISLFDGQEVVLHPKQEASHVNVLAKLTVDPGNQIFGDFTVNLYGGFYDDFVLTQDTQKIVNYFSNALKVAEDKEIQVNYGNDETAKFSLPIKDSAKIDQQENYYFFNIPEFKNGIAHSHFDILPTDRDFPLVVPALDEKYEYHITLPKSVMWVGKEIHKSYKESFGEMTIDMGIKNGRLVVLKHLKIYSSRVMKKTNKSPMNVESKEGKSFELFLDHQEYEIFRKMMIDWHANAVNELVFKR